MPLDKKDFNLLQGVHDGNMGAVKAALEAGASVNGPPDGREQHCPPIVTATLANRVGMVQLLLERGADPDRPVLTDITVATPGERALHICARGGRAEIARVLLEAGADPALAEERGFLPLHMAALKGHMDIVDMLYARAPGTLNVCADMGQTPLLSACCGDQEGMVSKLLSLGAMQRIPPHETDTSPLMMATGKGFVGVMRVLINEGGIWAVGGEEGLGQALYMAVHFHRTTILRMLLAAVGEEERPGWANTINSEGTCLLHNGAGFCYPAAVSILLQAGADETARDSQGRVPLDVIGADIGRYEKVHQMDRGKEVAIRRMLQRGPAYRARSWAWPSDEGADAGGSGDGDTAAAAAAAAAALSSPPAVKTPPVIGVRIFRPKEKNSSMFFVRLVGRYCAKD